MTPRQWRVEVIGVVGRKYYIDEFTTIRCLPHEITAHDIFASIDMIRGLVKTSAFRVRIWPLDSIEHIQVLDWNEVYMLRFDHPHFPMVAAELKTLVCSPKEVREQKLLAQIDQIEKMYPNAEGIPDETYAHHCKLVTQLNKLRRAKHELSPEET